MTAPIAARDGKTVPKADDDPVLRVDWDTPCERPRRWPRPNTVLPRSRTSSKLTTSSRAALVCDQYPLIPLRPRYIAPSSRVKPPSQSISGCMNLIHDSTSRRFQAAAIRLSVSTFSSDIAYSRSPAASRASSLVPCCSMRAIFPSASQVAQPSTSSSSTPLCARKVPPDHRYDAVLRSGDVLDLGPEIGPDTSHRPQPLPKTVKTPVGHVGGAIGASLPNQIRVIDLPIRLTGLVQVANRMTNDLDVLLRHRPSSISGGRGGRKPATCARETPPVRTPGGREG